MCRGSIQRRSFPELSEEYLQAAVSCLCTPLLFTLWICVQHRSRRPHQHLLQAFHFICSAVQLDRRERAQAVGRTDPQPAFEPWGWWMRVTPTSTSASNTYIHFICSQFHNSVWSIDCRESTQADEWSDHCLQRISSVLKQIQYYEDQAYLIFTTTTTTISSIFYTIFSSALVLT